MGKSDGDQVVKRVKGKINAKNYCNTTRKIGAVRFALISDTTTKNQSVKIWVRIPTKFSLKYILYVGYIRLYPKNIGDM